MGAEAPPCPLCADAGTQDFAQVAGGRYRRCPRCLLTFLEPAQRPDAEEELAEYRLHENDPSDPRYRRFLSQLLDRLVPRLPPGAEGLDYGCGPGPAISVMLGELGLPVQDYDPLFRPDAAALRRTYDFVTCTEVVEHFHHPGREFARLDGLLRPGGWLGVMTSLLTDDIDFAGWGYVREASHVTFYRPETLAWIAARHRWTLETDGRRVAVFGKAR